MVNPVEVTRTDCEPAVIRYGEKWEQHTAVALQWFALIFSLVILIWYIKQTANKKCGWEEFYVCAVESEFLCQPSLPVKSQQILEW